MWSKSRISLKLSIHPWSWMIASKDVIVQKVANIKGIEGQKAFVVYRKINVQWQGVLVSCNEFCNPCLLKIVFSESYMIIRWQVGTILSLKADTICKTILVSKKPSCSQRELVLWINAFPSASVKVGLEKWLDLRYNPVHPLVITGIGFWSHRCRVEREEVGP